jgi:teichuronic acid biosynthesis glycosyltransferase TuaG
MLPVTVVIPSTGRPYLIEALRSVLSQTQRPQEIIVCFDGPLFSGSEIEESLRSLADDTVQFFELRKNSGGPGKPRNVGIALSTQPFIATLDDDDSWLPEKLQIQMPVFADPEVVAVGSNALTVSNGVTKGSYFGGTTPRANLSNFAGSNPLITSSVICRKSLLLEAGGFNEDIKFSGIEDYLLWMRIATMGKIVNLAQPLLQYEAVSTQSLSSSVEDSNIAPVATVLRDVIAWARRSRRVGISVGKLRFYSARGHLQNLLRL